MDLKCRLDERLNEITTILSSQDLCVELEHLINAITESIARKSTIFVCGNGGSAADSLHFSGEMVGRFCKERKPLSCISLNSDIATLTAISNDYSYDHVFTRQLEAHYNEGDFLFVLSTSGASKNIINVLEFASKNKVKTGAILGKNRYGSNIEIDYLVTVPSEITDLVQDIQKILIHQICYGVERFVSNE